MLSTCFAKGSVISWLITWVFFQTSMKKKILDIGWTTVSYLWSLEGTFPRRMNILSLPFNTWGMTIPILKELAAFTVQRLQNHFVNNWWEVLSRKIVITSLTNHWISKERRMLLVKIGQGRNKSWTSSVVDFSRRRTSQWRNSVERRAAGYLLHPQSTIITSLSTSESSMTLQIPLPIKVSSIDFRVWKVFHERRRCYIHSR